MGHAARRRAPCNKNDTITESSLAQDQERARFRRCRFVARVLVILPLGLVFFHLLTSGASSVNWAFFTQLPTPVGETGGGMANAIVGSGELLGARVAHRRAGRRARRRLSCRIRSARANSMLRFGADVLNGVPSIIWGIVVYGSWFCRSKVSPLRPAASRSAS